MLTTVPLFFSDSYSLVPKIDVCPKYFFRQKSQKAPKVICLIKNYFQLLDATPDWGPAKISPFGIKVKMQAKK